MQGERDFTDYLWLRRLQIHLCSAALVSHYFLGCVWLFLDEHSQRTRPSRLTDLGLFPCCSITLPLRLCFSNYTLPIYAVQFY